MCDSDNNISMISMIDTIVKNQLCCYVTNYAYDTAQYCTINDSTKYSNVSCLVSPNIEGNL